MRIVLSLLLLWLISVPAFAQDPKCARSAECGREKISRPRGPIPARVPLVCVWFEKNPGVHAVMLTTWVGGQTVISDQKDVNGTTGHFCWPRSIWYKLGSPDKLRLCAIRKDSLKSGPPETAAQLNGEAEVAKPTAPLGVSTHWRACIKGVAGCGGRDHEIIPAR